MSRRHDRDASKKKGPTSSESLRSEVSRFIERGQIKDAFKTAKLAFHQEASSENRLQLERTYLLRLRELLNGKMTATAREVAGHVLSFGITEPQLLQELILLLPQVGMVDRAQALSGRLQSPEAKAALSNRIADRAVLHDEQASDFTPELKDSIQKIRSAWTALDSGKEAEALEQLQGIHRNSPMADWRYFIRGLAAFKRQDEEGARTNWERLDAQRSAARIATSLQRLGTGAAKMERDILPLEMIAFGEPVLGRLRSLEQALNSNDWEQVTSLLGPVNRSLERVDPRMAERITEIVTSALLKYCRDSDDDPEPLARKVLACLKPPAFDPHWNRFFGLLWQNSYRGLGDALTCWSEYLIELNSLSDDASLTVDQKKAVIFRHVAQLSWDGLEHLAEMDAARDSTFQSDPGTSADHERGFECILGFLKQSLELDPTQLKTHLFQLNVLHRQGQKDKWKEAAIQLLERFPEESDTIQRLIQTSINEDNPEDCRRWIEQYRRVKPLDSSISDYAAWAHYSAARQLAVKKQYDAARQEFAKADALNCQFLEPYRILARKASLEFKAGEIQRAEDYVAEAVKTLKDPVPLWLALSIELARYKAPKSIRDSYNKNFRAQIPKRKTAEVAGELASIMMPILMNEIEYTGRATHVRDVLAYLRPTSRLRFTESQLEGICHFLREVGDQESLLAKFVARGYSIFRNSPFFCYMRAMCQMESKDRNWYLYQAHQDLDKALRLAQASSEPRYQMLIPEIEMALSVLNAMTPSFGFPFGSPFGFASAPNMSGFNVEFDDGFDDFE